MISQLSLRPVAGYKPADVERLRVGEKYSGLIREELRLGRLVSYVGNKRVPLLGLYRYKEAFSLALVQEFIRRFRLSRADYIFDPFAGMGTTLFAAMMEGIPSVGLDRLPVAVFVANSLPRFLTLGAGELLAHFEELAGKVGRAQPAEVAMDVPIMRLAFGGDVLLRLRQWKTVIDRLAEPYASIFLLLFFSILEETSYTSKDGQFLRLRRDKKTVWPDEALHKKVRQAEQEMSRARIMMAGRDGAAAFPPTVVQGDARDLDCVPFERPPTAIITSPPYVNRYDYTRTYSLELCFHFVKNFAELRSLRQAVLRSHIESRTAPGEAPPHPAVREVLGALKSKKLNNPRIPDMLTGYFVDMAKAIQEWARVLAPGAQVAMVVDNVRFEGELIPVDLVLSELAEEQGFQVREILVARYKGNSSQQMGKYGRVPVRESIVVWRKD